MSIDERRALLELVARGINIPPQPRILVELRERESRGNYDVRGLARIISQDPGITGMLFRISRSPIFGKGKQLETLNQVLTLIGIKQVYCLVWAEALATSIPRDSRKALDVFWERSQQVAQLSAIVAQDRVTVCNVFPEQAYMAGMFYGCGVAVLMQRFPDYCSSMRVGETTEWPDLTEEDARFNVDHCTIGYLVARHWKLPDFICRAIRYHDELPPENEFGATRSVSSILLMANHLYHRMNRLKEPRWNDIREDVLAELGIFGEDEEEVFALKVEDKFVLEE